MDVIVKNKWFFFFLSVLKYEYFIRYLLIIGDQVYIDYFFIIITSMIVIVTTPFPNKLELCKMWIKLKCVNLINLYVITNRA